MSELCLLFTIYCVARARQSSMMRESAIEREPKVGWSTLQSWDSRSQHVFLMGWKKVMQSRACGIWSVYPLWNWVWSPATPNIMLAVSSRFFQTDVACLGALTIFPDIEFPSRLVIKMYIDMWSRLMGHSSGVTIFSLWLLSSILVLLVML